MMTGCDARWRGLNPQYPGRERRGERRGRRGQAVRKGWSIAEAERWLAPVLNDDPLAAVRTAAE
jgi:hypothetical protein